jgi:hypothetical protein
MLVGNKKDLESQVDVSYEEAAQFAEENGLVFVEASAKTGQNVEEAFLRTAQLIAQNVKDGYGSHMLCGEFTFFFIFDHQFGVCFLTSFFFFFFPRTQSSYRSQRRLCQK